MPNPCPDWAWSGCYGPYRVSLDLTLPDGYVDQQIPPPGGGFPGATVSELEVALGAAFGDEPAATTVRVTTVDEHGTTVRTSTCQVGSTLVFHGLTDPEGEVTDETWTAEIMIYATDPITSEPRDYAYVAGLWAAQVSSVTTPASGAEVGIGVVDVWAFAGSEWQPLPSDYPASAGRQIELVEGE